MTISYCGIQHSVSGVNVYAIFRDLNEGSVYSYSGGNNFEAYLTANLDDYDVPCAEEGTASRYYSCEIPFTSATTWGWQETVQHVEVLFFVKAGASPAEGDTFLGRQEMYIQTANGIRWFPHKVGPVECESFTDGAITKRAFDNSTAFPLERSDYGQDRISRSRGSLMQAAKMESR